MDILPEVRSWCWCVEICPRLLRVPGLHCAIGHNSGGSGGKKAAMAKKNKAGSKSVDDF